MQQQLNFFSPYIKTDKPSPLKNVATIFLLIFLLTVASYIVLQVQSLMLKKGISDKEDILAHYDAVELQYLADTKQKIANLTMFKTQIGQIENDVSQIDKINIELVQKIFANVSPGVLLKDLSINRTEIRLLGIANSRPAIAEFEYNMRNSGIGSDIKVTNISLENNLFSFNMLVTFSEGAVQHEN